MVGTLLDAGVALYVGGSSWRGRKRKLSGELGRLVGVGVAFALGCGAFKGLDALVAQGRFGFVGAFVVGLVGVGLTRRALARAGHHATRDWLDRTISEKMDRTLGMVAGGARALILALVGVGAVYLAPLEGLHRTLQSSSLVGRAVGALVGGDAEVP